MSEVEPNYCHDPELRMIAASLGIVNPSQINWALSLGECGYGGFEAAEAYLLDQAARAKENRVRQKALGRGLTDREKKEILERYGVDE